MQEAARVDDFPAVDDIVFRTGEMLGRLHWGGYDGRDVELIMARTSFSGHGVAMNIIDFNQVLACWSPAMFKLQLFS